MKARLGRLAPSPLLVARARGMLFAPTAEEEILWRELSARRLGVAFRRQVVLGKFIADFVAPSARLIVELDGAASHRGRQSADRRRDEKLRRLGYRTLRIDAELVHRDLHAAVELIRAALAKPP